MGDRLCRFEVRDIDGVRSIAIIGGFVRCALRVDAIERGLVQERVLPFGDIGEGDLDKAGTDAAEILFVGAVRNRIRCVGGNLRPGAGFVQGDLYFIGIGGAFEVQFELIHVQGIFGILHPVFVRAGVFRHPLGGWIAVVGHSAVAAGGEGGMVGLIRLVIPASASLSVVSFLSSIRKLSGSVRPYSGSVAVVLMVISAGSMPGAVASMTVVPE